MDSAETMKAVGFHRYLPIADPDSFLDLRVPRPTASGRDLLVEVRAVSVNPVDTKIRSPKDVEEKHPKILGFDAAGVVVETGPDCVLFQPGDAVYYAGDRNRSGSNSAFQLVDERIVGKKPKSVGFAEASALPLTALTAWEAFVDRLGITPNALENRGQVVLIIGAAGGVGSIATQIGNLFGLTVIGTASRPETVEWAKRHGAHHVINHRNPFAAQLDALGIADLDYIFCLQDMASYWDQMTDLVAAQGKICSIVTPSTPLNLSPLQGKSATFVAELMFTRAMYQTADMIRQHEILNTVADLVDQGKLVSAMTERLAPINAAHIKQAHARIESGRTIGKIVIEGFD